LLIKIATDNTDFTDQDSHGWHGFHGWVIVLVLHGRRFTQINADEEVDGSQDLRAEHRAWRRD
jgi:hypothetical protein